MKKLMLSVAKEFSRTPGPRKTNEGDYSGEAFLDNVLVPKFQEALDRDAVLRVDLDGTAGFATSFLEEAFGGLARKYSSEEVLKHIEFISEDEPYLEEDITTYIQEGNLLEMV